MAEARRSASVRSWLGPFLLISTVLAASALLEAATDRPQEEWLVRTFLVIGLLAVTVYVVLVQVPRLRIAKDLRILKRGCEDQNAAIDTLLQELRRGDLVKMNEPIQVLSLEMQNAVGTATRALTGLFQQIQSSSVEVASAAGSVQETSSELASASSQQAAAVVEITATMEELARTAGQIAHNASKQAQLAVRSEQAGDAGADSVTSAVAGVEVVHEHMQAIGERADVLDSRSREIYRILDLITEISQETHILALNAAIEASAAGEHGERFSVVADEVRRLAERSRESVDSVRSHLDEFAGAIRGVVVATEEGNKAVVQVSRQSHSAQESIGQLRQALADTAQAAREISLATQEQRTASDQVALTLKEISEVTQRMADGLERYTGAADHLDQLALSIQLLTQSFRIDSQHSLKHQVAVWSEKLSAVAGNLATVEGILEQLLSQCQYVELVYLVDLNGKMTSFVVNQEIVGDREHPGSVAVGQSYEDRPWFQAVTRDQQSIITPIYSSLMTRDPCFTIATAVFDDGGEIIGTLGIDVNIRNWTKI